MMVSGCCRAATDGSHYYSRLPLLLNGAQSHCCQVTVLLFSSKLAAQSKGYSKAMLGAADSTVSALREMVDGSKVVKLQSWEQPYRELIQRWREAELVHLRKIRLVTVVTMGMGRASPILANCVSATGFQPCA